MPSPTPMMSSRAQRTTSLPALLFAPALCLAGWAGCQVEPIPSIESAPEFVASAAPASGGDIAVVGRPLAVDPSAALRVHNRTSVDAVDVTAAANGSFVVTLAASPGDVVELTRVVEGQELPGTSVAVSSVDDSNVPPAPGANGQIEVSAPVKSTTRLVGRAGAGPGSAWIYVANPREGLGVVVHTDSDGAFEVMVPAVANDRLQLVASDDDRSSGTTEIEVPATDLTDIGATDASGEDASSLDTISDSSPGELTDHADDASDDDTHDDDSGDDDSDDDDSEDDKDSGKDDDSHGESGNADDDDDL